MIILLVPFIYIAICSGMSSALPPVDYKAISQEQHEPAKAAPEEK